VPNFQILSEIVIIFGAALVVIFVCNRIRLPAIVGYLLTGVLIGPHGLAFISDTQHVEVFAELAVVLILFVIGLEVSLKELKELGRFFLGGGSLQSTITGCLATFAARFLGAAWPLAIFCGFVVTLSSTAIVLKLLGDRREMKAPHGRLSLGILLFQDLLIVPMLLAVPLLAGSQGLPIGSVLLSLAEGLGVVVVVFLLGRYLLPPLLGLLARTGMHELLLLAAIFACLGGALVTHHLHLSMALGGFLAGVVLAESDLRYLIRAEVGPFRVVFNSLFFTSIGMLLSLPFVTQNIGAIVGVTSAILVAKALTVFLVARLLRLHLRTAITAALILCQIGEFSFVLLQVGRTEGLLDESLYAMLIAASVLTMLTTPLLLAGAGPLANFLLRGKTDLKPEKLESMRGHVVICGWGLSGQHLASVLKEGRLRYRVVDIDPLASKKARSEGEEVLFGDAGRAEILTSAGVETAAAMVLTLPDPVAARQAVGAARSLNPELHIIARSESLEEVSELLSLGANEVVTQDLETSIEITRRVLKALRLPGHLVRTAARFLHANNYEALRGPGISTGLSKTVLDVLAAGTAEVYLLGPDHWARGLDLRGLDLRQVTRATILAVLRGDQVLAHPEASLLLKEGDTLVLAGSHMDVGAAMAYMDREKAQGQEKPRNHEAFGQGET